MSEEKKLHTRTRVIIQKKNETPEQFEKRLNAITDKIEKETSVMLPIIPRPFYNVEQKTVGVILNYVEADPDLGEGHR